jgi:hypothetical protein
MLQHILLVVLEVLVDLEVLEEVMDNLSQQDLKVLVELLVELMQELVVLVELEDLVVIGDKVEILEIPAIQEQTEIMV